MYDLNTFAILHDTNRKLKIHCYRNFMYSFYHF